MPLRQNVLILYLASSALDSKVIAWTRWDGTGDQTFMAGDGSEPPFKTGLHALRAGWRLFQFSQLLPETPGQEFRTSYLKYEFAFEQLVE